MKSGDWMHYSTRTIEAKDFTLRVLVFQQLMSPTLAVGFVI